MVSPVMSWCCQIKMGSFSIGLPVMCPTSVKAPRQNRFDPMNLRSDIAGRNSRDLADRCGIHAFEIQEHQLPVERFEMMDQLQKPVERTTLSGIVLVVL